jgi:hypothetical protein
MNTYILSSKEKMVIAIYGVDNRMLFFEQLHFTYELRYHFLLVVELYYLHNL